MNCHIFRNIYNLYSICVGFCNRGLLLYSFHEYTYCSQIAFAFLLILSRRIGIRCAIPCKRLPIALYSRPITNDSILVFISGSNSSINTFLLECFFRTTVLGVFLSRFFFKWAWHLQFMALLNHTPRLYSCPHWCIDNFVHLLLLFCRGQKRQHTKPFQS